MPRSSRRARRARRAVVPLVAVPLALAACGGDDGEGAASARPHVTVQAGDATLVVPPTIPGGLVDVTLEGASGEQEHNLVFARLKDGVTYEQMGQVPPEQLDRLVTVEGSAAAPAGARLDVTLDLEPGSYAVVDLPGGETKALARTTVTPSAGAADEPVAEGVLTMGPGLVVRAPENFDGTGVWRFENRDPEKNHEALLGRLAPGKTIADVVDWGHGGFQGPPPFAGPVSPSVGALGPGGRAWATLGLEPGEYALVCFIPGESGLPHFAEGMIAQVSVGSGL